MSRERAIGIARRAGRVGARYPYVCARAYRQAAALFAAVGEHTAARDCDEAAEIYDQVARMRAGRVACRAE